MKITIPEHVWDKHIHKKVNSQSPVYQQNTLRVLGFDLMLEMPQNEDGQKENSNQVWAHPSGWFVYLEADKFLKSNNHLHVFGLEYNFFETQFDSLSEDARKRRKKMFGSSVLDLAWLKDHSLIFGNFSPTGEELSPRNFLDFIKNSQDIATLVPLEQIDRVLFEEMNVSLQRYGFKNGSINFLNRGLQFNSKFKKRNSHLLLSQVSDKSDLCALPKMMDREEVYFIKKKDFWEDVKTKILKLNPEKKQFTDEERSELQDFFEDFRNAEHMSEWVLKIKESTVGINNLELLWTYFINNTNNVLDYNNRFSELCETLAQSPGQEVMQKTLFREIEENEKVQLPMTLNTIASFSNLEKEMIDRPLETFAELMEKSDIEQWSWENKHYNTSGLLLELILNRLRVTSFDDEYEGKNEQKELVDILEMLEKKQLWSVTETIRMPHAKTHHQEGFSLDFSGKSWKDLRDWLSEFEQNYADSLLSQTPFVVYLKNKIDQYLCQHSIKKVAESALKVAPRPEFRF